MLREAVDTVDYVEGLAIIERTNQEVADDIILHWNRLVKRFNTILIDLGQRLTGSGRQFIDWANLLMDAYDQASPATKEFVAAIMAAGPALIAAGIGLRALAFALYPFYTILKLLMPLVGRIGGAILAGLLSPVGLVVAGIAGAALLIYKYWDDIRAYFAAGIEKLKKSWSGVWESFQSITDMESFLAFLMALGGALARIGAFWGGAIKDGFLRVFSDFGQWIWDMLPDAVKGWLGAADDFLGRAATATWEKAEDLGGQARDWMREELGVFRNDVMRGVETAATIAETALAGLPGPYAGLQALPYLPVGPISPQASAGAGTAHNTQNVSVKVENVTIQAEGASAEEIQAG